MALCAAACTQLGFAAANAPGLRDVAAANDVMFDKAHALALDVYAPKSHADALPVIVFIHGGRWQSGDKGDYAFAGAALARQGFVVVIPDYRKYPDVKFPAFVDDAARAVEWAHENIAPYGGDPARLFVAGHSSGAHVGALLAADERYVPRGIIKGFAGLAGPYAFTPDEPDLQDMFGPPQNYPAMQVTRFIDGREPPMLLLYGTADKAVAPYNLERLVTAVHAKGGQVETILYPDVTHTGIIAGLSWFRRGNPPVAQDMARFFKAVK